MKKNYAKPEWEIIVLATNDVITTSNKFEYDPDDILNDKFQENWDWD